MDKEKDKIFNYITISEFKIEELIEVYNPYINTIIRNSYINLSKEDEEEIVLDVFLSLWKNKEKLDINKSMSAYIAGITNNLIRKKLRNQKVDFNIEDYDEKIADELNLESSLIESEENKKIISELENLKEDERDIFILYYYELKKIKEISIMYNMSESKVKSKLFRIRKKLRKILNKEGII